MAKSKQTFNKKEKEKARLKKRQDKEEKKEERKAYSRNGKSLDEMLAYVDENGNLTSSPPDPKKQLVIRAEDIQINIKHEAIVEDNSPKTGVVTMFNNSKGFGFIKDSLTGDSVFVHMNALNTQVREGDKVSFEVEKTFKGKNAINVSVVK